MIMSKKDRTYALGAVIALATLLVYLPALRNGFVIWDDDFHVLNNYHIRAFDLQFLRWAFSDISQAGFWYPLAWLSHALDYAVWGLNPVGHHLTSILLHAANTFLVVRLVIVLLEAATARARAAGSASSGDRRSVLIAAGVAGVLFGIHPLHVESVAWVSERKDVLCAFFTLLSVLAYAAHAERRAIPGGPAFSVLTRPYLVALVLFLFALMSKPMAVTVPAVLLLLDWYPFGRLRGWRSALSLLGEKVPFLALSLAESVVTLIAQRKIGAMLPLGMLPFPSRVLLAFKALVAYLGKMVLPLHLIPLYPIPKQISFLSFEFLPAVIIVIAATAACVLVAGRSRIWLAVWGSYVVTLLPVLGLLQAGVQSMADRFVYLPGIGLFLLAGVGAARLWERAGRLTGGRPAVRRLLAATACVAVLSLTVLTLNQIALWKDSITLWTAVIEQEPKRVPIAYNNRGVAYRERGDALRALADYDAAISLYPDSARVFTNRGIAYADLGHLDQAIDDFDRALAIDGNYADAYTSRGLAYAKTGEYDQALEDLTRAIALKPSSVDAYLNRGLTYAHDGRFERAIEDYDRLLALDPTDHLALSSRGEALAKTGRLSEALADQTRALSLKPDFVQAYRDRAVLYGKMGRNELAARDLQTACELGDRAGCEELRSTGGSGGAGKRL